MKVANALTHPSEHPLDDLRRVRVEGRRLHVLLLANCLDQSVEAIEKPLQTLDVLRSVSASAVARATIAR